MDGLQILICDDDKLNNYILANEILKNGKYDIEVFDNTENCLMFMKYKKADLVIISVCSKNINYRSVIDLIHQKEMKSVICLIGEKDSQSVNVYTSKCDCFIKKPYSTSEIVRLLETFNLLSKRIKRIFVRTFGRFDVFVNDSILNFHNSKAKELFALCIDHNGGSVNMDEAIDKLWPQRSYDDRVKRLYRKAVNCINKCLDENGVPNIFENSRGSCCVRADFIECDYYAFLKDPVKNNKLFNGEYMFEYPWAENTLAHILKIAEIKSDVIAGFMEF